jgi:hypothetical protein
MPATATATAPPSARLEILDSASQPLYGKASVAFIRGGVGDKKVRVTLTGKPIDFYLDGVAPSGTPFHCEILINRFRPMKSGFAIMSPGLRFEQRINVMRNPTKWKPVFSPWNELGRSFTSLKRLLRKSDNLRVLKPKIELGSFTTGSYDAAANGNSSVVLAKSALLNIYWALSHLIEPVGRERTWASFLEKFIFISRERIVAQVDPQMFTLVDGIDKNIDEHRDQYEPTRVGNHIGNLPPEAVPNMQRIVSIKTNEARGNLQLTVALFTDGSAILDADMDENGEAVAHFFDALLVHRFTGGTHPVDIHECIRMREPNADLGYTLA